MEIEALFGLAGAGVVLALVAVIRQATGFPDRFTSLLAVLMGIAWNTAIKATSAADDITWGAAVMLGVLSGLAASGLWTGGKVVARDMGSPGGTGAPPPAG